MNQYHDLLERIQSDQAFPALDFSKVLDSSLYIGRSAQQVEEFVAEVIEPIRKRYPHRSEVDSDQSVRV